MKRMAGQWDSWAARTHGDPWEGPIRNDWGEEASPNRPRFLRPG